MGKIPPTVAFSCHIHLTLTLSCVIWLECVCWACIPAAPLVHARGEKVKESYLLLLLGSSSGRKMCVAEDSSLSGSFLSMLLSNCCPLCSLASVCLIPLTCRSVARVPPHFHLTGLGLLCSPAQLWVSRFSKKPLFFRERMIWETPGWLLRPCCNLHGGQSQFHLWDHLCLTARFWLAHKPAHA